MGKRKRSETLSINSSDMESGSSDDSEDDNPHGFVEAGKLDTFKRNKRDRIAQQIAEKDKNAIKEQFKKKSKKKGGETNKKKLKHKPFMMVKQKKIKTMDMQLEKTKHKIKRINIQLGKFKKN